MSDDMNQRLMQTRLRMLQSQMQSGGGGGGGGGGGVEVEEEDTDNNRLSFHQLTTHGHHQIKWEMVAMDILVSSNTACLPNLHPCFIRTWD